MKATIIVEIPVPLYLGWDEAEYHHLPSGWYTQEMHGKPRVWIPEQTGMIVGWGYKKWYGQNPQTIVRHIKVALAMTEAD